ncbi:MAG: hypothetical protein ACXVYL_19160, partial [Oryzihumus sp.]
CSGALLPAPSWGATSDSSAGTSADTRLSPTILVGTGGVTWSDVSPRTTPALWSLLREGATAALSIHSVYLTTCPADGWLGLSAGNRAAAPGPGQDGSRQASDPCPPIPTVDSGVVPGWGGYVAAAAATKFDSRLGTLGETLAGNGQCVQAVGPGAGLGAAYLSGAVPRYAAYDAAQLTDQLSRCRVTLVDVGSLRDPADVAPSERGGGLRSRDAQLKAIDTRIAQVLAAAPSGSNVMVASMADAGQTPQLGLVAAKGPDFGSGTLGSSSTRQTGLVQAPDLTVTLLAAGGVPAPPELGGAVLRRDSAGDSSADGAAARLRGLVDQDQASQEVHDLVPPFFYGLVGAQLALYVVALLLWRSGRGSTANHRRLLATTRRVAVVGSAVPVSTFLANLLPWWRLSVPMVSLVASVAGFTAVISAAALLGPWARRVTGPMAVVSLATVVVLAADVVLGSHLQLSSLLGLQPVVGGRFYGVGNVTFAVFASAALLLGVAVSGHYVREGRPRLAAGAALSIGLAAVAVDGAPMWGADGGGPPALLPGLAYFVLAILGIRMTWRRGLLVVAGTAALFLVVAFADWLRPVQSRSHLGRFVQSMLDGGASDIVTRKLDQNLSILLSTPLAMLVPVGLVLAIVVLARPVDRGPRALRPVYERCPTLRPGLVALLITLTIGFAANDSGVAIPANGAIIAIPLVIAVCVAVLEEQVRTSAASRSLRRR